MLQETTLETHNCLNQLTASEQTHESLVRNLPWLPKGQPGPARAGAPFVHSQMQGPQVIPTEEHWHCGHQGCAHPLHAPSVSTENTPSKPAHCQTSALDDAQGLCCPQATGFAWNSRKGSRSQSTHTSKTKRTAAVSRVPRAWLWQAVLCQELALISPRPSFI